MKTSNHHDPLLLNFKNNPIREAPDACTTPVTVYGIWYMVGKRRGLLLILSAVAPTAEMNRSPSAKRRSSYQDLAALRSASASGNQTTGSVTAF
jgi:hypothetical protein